MDRKNISVFMNLAMLSMIDSELNEEINWEYVKSEYDLIKEKKSNLSRSEREWIVREWENINVP